MGARVRVIAPPTLLPSAIDRMGVEVFTDMREGLKDVDIVMMLRLQLERMQGSFVPSVREYFRFFGLDLSLRRATQAHHLRHHARLCNRLLHGAARVSASCQGRFAVQCRRHASHEHSGSKRTGAAAQGASGEHAHIMAMRTA